MKKVPIAVLALGLACTGWWWAASYHADAPTKRLQSTAQSSALHPGQAVRRDGDEPADTSAREVAELRAQLRKKDELVGALLLTAAARAREVGSQAPTGQTRAARVIAELDQRLFGGILSAPEVQEVEDALKVATQDLPSTFKSTVACSTELCRITVQGAESELDAQSGGVLERIPKKFAGGIVLPEGDGQRAVFVATRQDLLAVAAEPEK